MIKSVKYFIQALLIYFLFLIGKVIGLNYSRKLFAFIFEYVGPIFKSQSIINKNLINFSKDISSKREREITSAMWKNYGMTFIEYIFLDQFKKNNSHISIYGEEILNNIFEKNQQAIFVSGHFANFELMSMEITKKKLN